MTRIYFDTSATATGVPFATFDTRLRTAAEALGLAVIEPPAL